MSGNPEGRKQILRTHKKMEHVSGSYRRFCCSWTWNIGPEAGMPVMEGKCALFKAFGDVDAFPLCIKSNDVDEIVNTIYMISGSFGGVNLEDISAPRCFEIEKKLKENVIFRSSMMTSMVLRSLHWQVLPMHLKLLARRKRMSVL